MTRLRIATFVICIAVLCAGSGTQAQKGEVYKARLSTVPMEVAMMSAIAGAGSANAILSGRELTVRGAFQGLRSPATTAQIHRGPVKGVRGPAVFDLHVSKATSGMISGSFELTRKQVADLRSGRLYVQIQSEHAPDGNLWGWLLR
jgi:CHRD domain